MTRKATTRQWWSHTYFIICSYLHWQLISGRLTLVTWCSTTSRVCLRAQTLTKENKRPRSQKTTYTYISGTCEPENRISQMTTLSSRIKGFETFCKHPLLPSSLPWNCKCVLSNKTRTCSKTRVTLLHFLSVESYDGLLPMPRRFLKTGCRMLSFTAGWNLIVYGYRKTSHLVLLFHGIFLPEAISTY